MKFTLKWLKEYLDTQASACEICDKLDQIGLEIEEVIDNNKDLKDFCCVLVENVENHPNSDHLHICKVKKADGEVLQIVCGAPNVKSGMKAVLAPVGITMPNSDFKISKSKIRGVESCGMLCSEKELGLGEDHTGILELPQDTELGRSIAEIKGLDDITIDINITPNRGDCLGVYGIARDLSATGIGTLKEFKDYKINATIPSPIKVEMQDNNCPEFLCRYIKNVKNCESPDWMKEKLIAIGLNPKSALVDITNYVMFVLNRPMHCYDADKINGNIVVKKSIGGEKFKALDHNEYTLKPGTTLINDSHDNILGLGGVIGGELSGSSNETQNILLECAIFEPISIATTARSLNINTDAKFRFERGVDALSGELAINYATHLIMTICGTKNTESSEIVKGTPCSDNHFCECGSAKVFKEKKIAFNIEDVELVLGIKIERQDIIDVLNKLGYQVKEETSDLDILTLTVPSWRNDVTIKENVIEDIIRIYGYDNLKEAKIASEKIGEDNDNIENKLFYDKMHDVVSVLSSNGMIEVISWSFMNETIASEFSLIHDDLKVQNPINSELSYMRPSIVPNLMTIAKYNQDRAIEDICIFEQGKVFINQTPQGQKEMVAGVRIGKTAKKDVFNSSRNYDIYDVKKDLYDVLKLFNINADNLIITHDIPDYYHPYRSGAVKMGNVILGVFGEIHPLKCNKIGLKDKVNAFEIYLDNLPKMKIQKTTQKKKFILNDLQPIHRDFAFIVDDELEIGKIVNSVKKVNKELIKDVHVFDIYEGDNISVDKKSVAFSVTIQPLNKTLTTEEIDKISDKIISSITNEYKGILRDN